MINFSSKIDHNFLKNHDFSGIDFGRHFGFKKVPKSIQKDIPKIIGLATFREKGDLEQTLVITMQNTHSGT